MIKRNLFPQLFLHGVNPTTDGGCLRCQPRETEEVLDVIAPGTHQNSPLTLRASVRHLQACKTFNIRPLILLLPAEGGLSDGTHVSLQLVL